MVKCNTHTKQKWKQKTYFWPKVATASQYCADLQIYFCLVRDQERNTRKILRQQIQPVFQQGLKSPNGVIFNEKLFLVMLSCTKFYKACGKVRKEPLRNTFLKRTQSSQVGAKARLWPHPGEGHIRDGAFCSLLCHSPSCASARLVLNKENDSTGRPTLPNVSQITSKDFLTLEKLHE